MLCQLAMATNIEMYKKLTVYYLHIRYESRESVFKSY